MIYRDITVEYYVNRASRKVFFDFDDAADPGKEAYESEIFERGRTYHMFKNNGHVSIRDCSSIDLVNQEAERLLQEELKIEAEGEKDHERAVQLAKIINEADYENATEWVIIKEKTSHSKWYQSWNGFGHSPSIYEYAVPADVADLAKEHFKIRRKHQGDPLFEFFDNDIKYRVTRISDHDNEFCLAGEFSWIE